MRLTLYTDYSLRMLMYLGLNPDLTPTIQQIADSFDISQNHLMKVAHELGQMGYVETVRGRNGGLRLAKPAKEIKLGDVINDCENDFALVECFDNERNQCVLTPACRLKHVLRESLDSFFQSLNQYSVADLLLEKKALMRSFTDIL